MEQEFKITITQKATSTDRRQLALVWSGLQLMSYMDIGAQLISHDF
jgi:hypothetical protein